MPVARVRTIACAMGAILLVASVGCRSGRGHARSHRDLVRAGMTPAEVVEELGEPADRWVKPESAQEVWLYRFSGSDTGAVEVMLGILLVAVFLVIVAVAAYGGGGGGGGLSGFGGGGGGSRKYYEFEIHFDAHGRVYGVTGVEATGSND